jgi:Mrp family chromosome partitioning ATPase
MTETKTIYQNIQNPPSRDQRPRIEDMGVVERFNFEKLETLKIVHAGTPSRETLNIFRELRTQLIQREHKQNFVCMVSSVCFGGGASYIARNLASIFALDKSKTSLLIDTNLYASTVDELIVGEANLGLTDYLADSKMNIQDVVYATGIPRVRATPLGSNSDGAAEYFSSEKMQHFISELKSRYSDRYIFIDAPTVRNSSEARILAELVDMVVLVVPHGKVTLDEINGSIDIIGKNKLAGLVYNN